MRLHVVGKCAQMCADGKQTWLTRSFYMVTEAKLGFFFFLIIGAKKHIYISAFVQTVGDQINQLTDTVYLKSTGATLNACGGAVFAIK